MEYKPEVSVCGRVKSFISLLTLLSFIAGAALTCTIITHDARAEITRGCKGTLFIDLYDVKGQKTNQYNTTIDEFEGRGACKNKLEANTCRVRAKDNVFRCATDLWNARWSLIGDPNDGNPDSGLPSICQGRNTGAKGIGPYTKNPHGQFFDIKHEMEYQACCKLQPKAKKLKMKLSVNSTGDKGCGKHQNWMYQPWGETRVLINNYEANCKDLRVHGLCGGKRTGG